MRVFKPLFLSLALLGACGQRVDGPATEEVPTATSAPDTRVALPSLHQTDYRLEGSYGLLFNGQLQTYPVHIAHHGRLWRADLPSYGGEEIYDYDRGQVALGTATRPIQDIHDLIYVFTGGMAQYDLTNGDTLRGQPGAPCAVLGETGTTYSFADGDGEALLCITQDGIPLQRTDERGSVFWTVTKLERGAQDPALFTTN